MIRLDTRFDAATKALVVALIVLQLTAVDETFAQSAPEIHSPGLPDPTISLIETGPLPAARHTSTRVREGALLGLITGSIVGGVMIHFGDDLCGNGSASHICPTLPRPNSDLDPGTLPVGLVGLFVGAVIGDRLRVRGRGNSRVELSITPGLPVTNGRAPVAGTGLRLRIPLGR